MSNSLSAILADVNAFYQLDPRKSLLTGVLSEKNVESD